MRSREECEALALADFGRLRGRLLRVTEVDGMTATDDSDMIVLSTPALVRVAADTNVAHSVLRWTDDNWLDPIYDVDLVEPYADLAARLRTDSLWSTAPATGWTAGSSRPTAGKR